MPLKPAVPVGLAPVDSSDESTVPQEAFKPTESQVFNMYGYLTQACIQSMPLGQFATDIEGHLKNVMATVDALAVFILERSK